MPPRRAGQPIHRAPSPNRCSANPNSRGSIHRHRPEQAAGRMRPEGKGEELHRWFRRAPVPVAAGNWNNSAAARCRPHNQAPGSHSPAAAAPHSHIPAEGIHCNSPGRRLVRIAGRRRRFIVVTRSRRLGSVGGRRRRFISISLLRCIVRIPLGDGDAIVAIDDDGLAVLRECRRHQERAHQTCKENRMKGTHKPASTSCSRRIHRILWLEESRSGRVPVWPVSRLLQDSPK